MSNVFFIADTHFGHRKVSELRGFASVEEHDEHLIAAWNAIVARRDTVWHLGDVLMGKELSVIERLNGTRKLVHGNHDTNARELAHYFDGVYGTVHWKRDIVLSHVPLHPSCVKQRWSLNIHGHMHDRKMMNWRFMPFDNAQAPALEKDPLYLCVSVERNYNFGPRPWEEIRDKLDSGENVNTLGMEPYNAL